MMSYILGVKLGSMFSARFIRRTACNQVTSHFPTSDKGVHQADESKQRLQQLHRKETKLVGAHVCAKPLPTVGLNAEKSGAPKTENLRDESQSGSHQSTDRAGEETSILKQPQSLQGLQFLRGFFHELAEIPGPVEGCSLAAWCWWTSTHIFASPSRWPTSEQEKVIDAKCTGEELCPHFRTTTDAWKRNKLRHEDHNNKCIFFRTKPGWRDLDRGARFFNHRSSKRIHTLEMELRPTSLLEVAMYLIREKANGDLTEVELMCSSQLIVDR
ncbi:hypothetical protein T439DRAFT_346761 [Meredithblackwellia eburnea MCA 4105]